ncbi:bifunctional biotin--[acetyl-CoA-carboxylase] ligase/biotin operon repressor BirA [Streptococcus himalayensis]|uniref:Bifunctional ligase/repressor BirA n=1 Tax=Streptococcus himalayensis TaxID=1888195 RepID=A0A917A418_9STRE|nr:bifunctional biotin--[acetyl-CoA-carboxylase] ligase/biotin operon repressor BirA [Streptococcus himalayensis]GGE25519.1 bifunctional ligase/repressor BirA [Streptococcus himalayensis]
MKTYETLFQLLYDAQDYLSGESLATQLGVSRTSIWKAIQRLEKKGITIESVKNKGYKWIAGDLLLPAAIQHHCPVKVRLNPSCQSTQLDAKAGIENGEQPNTLYLAPYQEAGRGRFGRDYYSPNQGGIYMSLHLKPQLPFEQLPTYTILVAAAIYKAVKELTLIDLDIKWVNDLYYHKKKVAGILTEAVTSVETGLVTDVIIGVGLNLSISHFPEELKDKATSLFPDRCPITRNELIAAIWNQFFHSSPEELIYLYRKQSLVLGQKISFEQNGQLQTGQAKDISDQGKLLVKLDTGTEIWLSSGEISLQSW